MVIEIIDEMTKLVNKMQEYIKQDIEDIKKAKHEQLLNRNEEKELMIEKIANYKKQLNQEIVNELQNGVDVNIYRNRVDNLEEELKTLYQLNRKLALIVEPIQQMYKEIVNEITEKNGGNIFHVKA
jgi:phosphoglycerate-specific signal transduction histidine kinase